MSATLYPDESENKPMSASSAAQPVSRQSRFLGAVLGAAIGDAMGHPTEFIRSFEAIYERYGPIFDSALRPGVFA